LVEAAVSWEFWVFGLPAVVFAVSLLFLLVRVWRKGLD
jgi:hypothetical protein